MQYLSIFGFFVNLYSFVAISPPERTRVRSVRAGIIRIYPHMKKDIHPLYFPKAVVTCACGAVFHVGSTKENINVEICSACHPFYTGNEKVIDTAGRVERFKVRASKRSVSSVKPKIKKG